MFKAPARFDMELAQEGKWHTVYDELGNDWGSYCSTLMDKTLPRYTAVAQRVARKYQNKRGALKNASEVRKIEAAMIAEYVSDWNIDAIYARAEDFPSDEKAAKAREIEEKTFSRDKLIELLCNPEMTYLLIELDNYQSEIRNFQPDDQEAPVEGN